MSASVRTGSTKIAGALVLSAVLVYFFVLPMVDVLDRPRAAAEGPHALIVASTRGGTADYALHTFMRGDVNGDMVVELLITAADENRTDVETISLHVTFYGPRGRAGAVTCQDKPTTANRWHDLGEGARNAFVQDATSTFAGAHPLGTDGDAARSGSFPQWRGDISVTTDDGGNAWENAALHCTIPASWVWVTAPQQTTGLLPQVNFNAIEEPTDHQADMYGDVSITRRTEWTLSESYPAATLDGYYLKQKLTHYWVGQKGTPSNLGYLTQPDLMFVRRYTTDDDAKTLTVGGIAVGVAGGLVVSSLSRLVDVAAAVRARRRERTTEEDSDLPV